MTVRKLLPRNYTKGKSRDKCVYRKFGLGLKYKVQDVGINNPLKFRNNESEHLRPGLH